MENVWFYIPPDKTLSLDILITTLSRNNDNNDFSQKSVSGNLVENPEALFNSSEFSNNIISKLRSANAKFINNNLYSDCNFYSGCNDEIQESENEQSALSRKRNYSSSSTGNVRQKSK